ncbi:MarR family winged helix-turn-helix transcriptional regulator [Streptomyces sp. NPDC058683]|uniref:MarR family winged helix-turn-helix transcriptional regulator n=1 Tax=Streptomyces sp. NPDC058683 TaxID=3346597 RepID=UPI0036611B51
MPEPQWLTDQEQSTWRALTALIRTVDEQLERQLQRDAQITLAGYVVLVTLSEGEEEAPRMSDLALSLGWSQSRLSHAMTWLEKSGWVQRTKCPTDRRSSLARLTDKGRQKLEDAAPGHVAAVRHLVFDALTAEQQQALAQISEAITTRATH